MVGGCVIFEKLTVLWQVLDHRVVRNETTEILRTGRKKLNVPKARSGIVSVRMNELADFWSRHMGILYPRTEDLLKSVSL